jgi:hypothetical protein
MRKSLIILIVLTIGLFSCGQDSNSKSGKFTKEKKELNSAVNVESQKKVAIISNDKFIDTKYEYIDSSGKHLIIENSLPKGGQKYTDHNGKEYVYAIFWTQITNEIDSLFEVTLDFSTDTFELPSSPDNYFKLFLPSENMTVDKAPLFNYGLEDLDTVLGNKLQQSSSFQKAINSKATCLFYVVTLFKEGVDGVVRAGLRLENEKIYYRVNDKEIQSGQVNIKNLELQK